MEPPQLNWNAAEVHDGTLTVEIAGEPDKDWIETFERTLALLSTGQGWGTIKLKSGKVKVKDVTEGSTDNLRFALDGAVQEANAHHAADEDEDEDGVSDPETDEDPASEADQRMTDRFRDPSE